MADTAKHSPGPWGITPDGHWLQLAGGESPVLGDHYLSLCMSATSRADKTLLAAAPDLLHALKLFVRAEKMARDGNPPTGADELIELGDAAIAKAEGV